MKLLLLSLVLLLAVGCKQSQEATDLGMRPEFNKEDAQFVKIATATLGDSAKAIPSDIIPFVSRSSGYIQIEWPVPQIPSDRPNPLGSSYYFLVILEDSEPFRVVNISVSR